MKKYLPLTEELHTYLLTHHSQAGDETYAFLREETYALGGIAQMAISPEQATFLSLLVASIGTRVAVEVGTFTGSSALAIARGLPANGHLYCFDRSDEWTQIARRHWQKAGVESQISLTLGDASETLKNWTPPEPLDFVFIDADKTGYETYYEILLPQVRANGLILFDNMLQHGRVVQDTGSHSPETKAIDALNRKLAKDERVQSVLLPIADGITICRKL